MIGARPDGLVRPGRGRPARSPSPSATSSPSGDAVQIVRPGRSDRPGRDAGDRQAQGPRLLLRAQGAPPRRVPADRRPPDDAGPEWECLFRPHMPMLPQTISSIVDAALAAKRPVEFDTFVVERHADPHRRGRAGRPRRPPHALRHQPPADQPAVARTSRPRPSPIASARPASRPARSWSSAPSSRPSPTSAAPQEAGPGAAPARLRLRHRRRRGGLRQLQRHRRPRAVDHQDRSRDRRPHRQQGRRGQAGAGRGLRLVQPPHRGQGRGRGDREPARPAGPAGARRRLRAGLPARPGLHRCRASRAAFGRPAGWTWDLSRRAGWEGAAAGVARASSRRTSGSAPPRRRYHRDPLRMHRARRTGTWPKPRSATRRCSSSSGRSRSSTCAPAPSAAGFSGVMAADHFQPWVPAAGPGLVRVGGAGRGRRPHRAATSGRA